MSRRFILSFIKLAPTCSLYSFHSYPKHFIPLFDQLRCIKTETRSVDLRRNEEITAKSVRLVQEDGVHRVVGIAEALEEAKAVGLDLIEVAAGSDPPVVRIADYAALHRQRRLKEKEREKKTREHQKNEKPKEIRMTPRISDHDLQLKIKKIKEVLEKGQKVSIVVMAPTSADVRMGKEAIQYIQSLLEGEIKVRSESGMNKQGAVTMTLIPHHEV